MNTGTAIAIGAVFLGAAVVGVVLLTRTPQAHPAAGGGLPAPSPAPYVPQPAPAPPPQQHAANPFLDTVGQIANTAKGIFDFVGSLFD